MTTGRVAHRPRLDGGYVIAHETNTVADIIPASFRYFPEFFPTLLKERSRLRFRLGKAFWREAMLPRLWAGSERSPFERFRALKAEVSSKHVVSVLISTEN
ncbi:hypothetical protein EN935_38620 [Mesorhizobium sp. M7D.F.Ca.US.004.03.1.1]|nr:hypothetical protein EN935_38620 [Mesorhizobium sp. M7D.F.Ca.US.004.03.1.1]